MRAVQQRATTQTRPDAPASGPPVLRAGSIQDLLGSVPAMLGFHPRRSLVGIAMHGKRLGFQLRVDLPRPDQVEDAATQLVAPLLAQRPDAVILIAYLDPEPPGARSDARMAADGLVGAMRRRFTDEGVEVREAIRCDGARYWSYLCTGSCCPVEGTPYEIESSPMLATAVYNGIEVLADRAELERRFAPVSGRRRARMEATTERVVERVLSEVGVDGPDEEVWIEEGGETHGRLLRAGADFMVARVADLPDTGPEPDDEDAARLGFYTTLIPVRDLAWSYIERANARAHLRLWTSVAQRAVSPLEPAPLCLAAFAAWLSGDGSQARCALDRVHRVAPEYSMGRLLERTLDGYVPPDAWRAFDRDAIWSLIPDADGRDCA